MRAWREEAGRLRFRRRGRGITAKLIRRHPHVFADADGRTARRSKACGSGSRPKRKPKRGPASAKARSPACRSRCPRSPARSSCRPRPATSASTGTIRARCSPRSAKRRDEIEAELEAPTRAPAAAEVGDLLFAVVNLARHIGADPEDVLRATNRKFERRFAAIERALAERGKTPSQSTPGRDGCAVGRGEGGGEGGEIAASLFAALERDDMRWSFDRGSRSFPPPPARTKTAESLPHARFFRSLDFRSLIPGQANAPPPLFFAARGTAGFPFLPHNGEWSAGRRRGLRGPFRPPLRSGSPRAVRRRAPRVESGAAPPGAPSVKPARAQACQRRRALSARRLCPSARRPRDGIARHNKARA